MVQWLRLGTFTAKDLGSIPGQGIKMPQASKQGQEKELCNYCWQWASLVAQLVKNPPATRETWVQSLGWEDRLKKGMATHSSILTWRILYSPWGHKELDPTEWLSRHLKHYLLKKIKNWKHESKNIIVKYKISKKIEKKLCAGDSRSVWRQESWREML